MTWVDPNGFTKSGTVVFGPSLSTLLPNRGADIALKIYKGIDADVAAGNVAHTVLIKL